jgi:hypothetical protein
MSQKSLDKLYDQLFQAQIEHRWKDACETQEEIRRIEDREEDYKEPVRKWDVA